MLKVCGTCGWRVDRSEVDSLDPRIVDWCGVLEPSTGTLSAIHATDYEAVHSGDCKLWKGEVL